MSNSTEKSSKVDVLVLAYPKLGNPPKVLNRVSRVVKISKSGVQTIRLNGTDVQVYRGMMLEAPFRCFA